jgi:hypothetical protein
MGFACSMGSGNENSAELSLHFIPLSTSNPIKSRHKIVGLSQTLVIYGSNCGRVVMHARGGNRLAAAPSRHVSS